MKAIELFNLLATKKVDSSVLGVLISESNAEVFSITNKQYNWLISILHAEFKNWDGNSAIGFSDNNFSYYVDPKKKTNNVPRYIPNQKQYGQTHYIVKRAIN